MSRSDEAQDAYAARGAHPTWSACPTGDARPWPAVRGAQEEPPADRPAGWAEADRHPGLAAGSADAASHPPPAAGWADAASHPPPAVGGADAIPPSRPAAARPDAPAPSRPETGRPDASPQPRLARYGSAGEVLVVDDEPEIVEVLRAYLEREGFTVRTASDGHQALAAVEARLPDLILLDWMLPGVDGPEICRRLRARSGVPIIMLTARSDEVDRVVGLELGCDDYVTKPFSPREVVARVRAVLRRARSAGAGSWREENGRAEGGREGVLRVGGLVVDTEAYRCWVDGREVQLTPTEFKLLSVLASHPGRVFTRLQLVERVQGFAFEGYERTIDAHIKNLRQKLGDPPRAPRYIATVYGVGYRLLPGGETPEPDRR